MNDSNKKKSGLRKLLETAKRDDSDSAGGGRKNLFDELVGLGWDDELTIDHEGALEEAEALAESSGALSKELGDMIPIIETASVARPASAELDRVENLLGEVERRVKIVRAALNRLENSGVVRANRKK